MARADFSVMARLYFETLLLAGAFLACGLAAGYFAHDRAQALIIGVSAWLMLLFALDLAEQILLDAVGQVFGHLRFGAAQQKRPHA